MKTLVVLLTYNERSTVAATLRAVHAALPAAEILVLDASSPDGTEQVARAVAAEIAGVSVRSCPPERGHGLACRDGFRWGLARGFEVLVEVDSDFARQVTALPALLAPLGQGWDLVIGSRYITDGRAGAGSPSQRLLTHVRELVLRGLIECVRGARFSRSSGEAAGDRGVGLRAYRADLFARVGLDEIPAPGRGFHRELVERALQCGARVADIPTSLTAE